MSEKANQAWEVGGESLNPKMAIRKGKKKPDWGKVAKFLVQAKKDIAELEKKGNLSEKGKGQRAVIRAIEQILKVKF